MVLHHKIVDWSLLMVKIQYKNKTQGFGLIEVMIGMVISILIFAGILNLFQRNKTAYQLNQNIATLQQDGRFATAFLSRTVRLAGFRTPPNINGMELYQNYEDIFPAGSELIAGTNDNINNSDSITVRYQGSPGGNIFDCLATPVQPNQIAVSTFFINNNNQLVCSAVNNGVANANNPDVLVDNVESMHIRFGEDLTGDGIANRYVPPGFVGLELNRVISVRISLLIRTQEQRNPIVDNKLYALQDVQLGPFNDQFVRRVFTTTVQVRSTAPI